MTINEAVGILQFNGAPEEGPTISDFIKARNLGIEALKRIKNARDIGYSVPTSLLPGETKD